VGSYEIAEVISKCAVQNGKQAKVHFIIDTGMGRLGIPYFCAEDVIRRCMSLPGLVFEGIYSHFANANDPEHPKTREQLLLFQNLLLNISDITLPLVHLANSDGINNFSESYFRMVRTGINLYGVFDLNGHRAYELKPTVSFCSRLIAKRELPAGYTIGYGCTYRLPKDTVVGTIPVGYADGIPFHLGKQAHVLINGVSVPVIGRVSMDYITVDLKDVPDVAVGERVVLFGKSGDKQITVEDWARLKLSHPYDILCSLGNRVRRVYLNLV
jgi:alanine racemase